MDRYADAVQQGLGHRGEWRVIPTAPVRSDLNGQPEAGFETVGEYWRRFVAYPVAAARRQGELWHVCDHGYGHLAALLPPQRTVVTCHDLMLLRSAHATGLARTPKALVRFRWSTSYLRKVAHVMCDSSATRDDVIRLTRTSPKRATVIPLGVEEYFRPLDSERRVRMRRELGFSDDALVVFSVGCQGYKNPQAGIDCLAELRARGIDAHLMRAGRSLADTERDYAKQMRVGTWIQEQGIVSDERLVALYNAADVVLHPSFWEGFGWPPLEAMACGTPVVVSSAPSLLEVVDYAGIVAEPTDVRGLVEGILRVTDPTESAEWRNRALRRAQCFSWDNTLRAITLVYDRVRAEADAADVRGSL